MKQLLMLAAGCMLAFTSNAQNKDTLKVNWGDYSIIMIEKNDTNFAQRDTSIVHKRVIKKPDGYFSGIDIGFNFLGTDGSLFETEGAQRDFNAIAPSSISLNFNVFEFYQELGTPHVALVSGASFGIKSYSFSKTKQLMDTGDSLQFVTAPQEFNKNKLRNFDISVPLLLAFNTSANTNKNVHLALGVLGSFVFKSTYKTTYDLDGKKQKDKVKGKDYSVQPLRADATVRLGYRNFTLFATYPLTALFDEDVTGNPVSPVTVGMRVIGF